MLWQCSAWAWGPQHLLSPQQSGRAVGAASSLLFLWDGAGASARARGGDYGQAETVAIRESGLHLAPLRPSFPIPALISGIARYYSYHNNVPMPGSPPCCREPALGRMERAGQWPQPRSVPLPCHGCIWAPRPPIPEQGWAQTPAEPGCGGDRHLPASRLVQVPPSGLSCAPRTSRGSRPANGWGWGQGWVALSPA